MCRSAPTIESMAGGPDRGQPTHFLTGRQWGMFTVRVPADFGKNKLVWTLVANGQELVIPASLHPDYEISPFSESAIGNSPPVVRIRGKRSFRPGTVGHHSGAHRKNRLATHLDRVGSG